MPKLQTLGFREIIKILEQFDFETISQKGSHVKVGRQVGNQKQILTIPNHKNLDKGTIKAIYNQISRFVPANQLADYFYTK